MSSTYFYIVIKAIKIFLYPTPTFRVICRIFRVRRKCEVLLTDSQEAAPSQGRKCLIA